MAAPVVRNHTEPVLREKKHLAVPGIRIQRPAMRKRYDRAIDPVFVVDRRTIFNCNSAHVHFLLRVCASRTARCFMFYFAGTNAGAPLSFTKNTTNFAGFVLLTFRPTTWTSLGPS